MYSSPFAITIGISPLPRVFGPIVSLKDPFAVLVAILEVLLEGWLGGLLGWIRGSLQWQIVHCRSAACLSRFAHDQRRLGSKRNSCLLPRRSSQSCL